MDKNIILELLKLHHPILRERYGVSSLALFGSVARNEAGLDSDIDILVDFSSPKTFDHYIQTKFYLEDLFGCEVDLVMPRSIKPRARPSIEREAIHVA